MSPHLHTSLYAFTQGLRAIGVNKVVISPGSRNAAFMQAVYEEGFELHSVVDERSAGFIGLGMSQATDEPVALLCTSGTAVLNYYPAVAEAYYSNTPLVVISADRPKALIDNWTGQCIRQVNVFENHIRASVSLPEHYFDWLKYHDPFADLINAVKGPDRGPIHINVPIPEPFYKSPWDPAHRRLKEITYEEPHREEDIALRADLRNGLCTRKILAIGGYGCPVDLELADHIPFFKDIMVPQEDGPYAHWDAFLNSSVPKKMLKELRPDDLITFGKYTVSKGLREFLKVYKPKRHFHVDLSMETGDPFGSKPIHVPVDPRLYQRDFLVPRMTSEFADAWKEALADYSVKLEKLHTDPTFNEYLASRTMLAHTKGKVHLGNSMPVRIASYIANHHDKTYFGNRGTSGIDGCLSTAVGHSVADGESQTLLIGDLSFFYDANGLWNDLDHHLRIVILNNGGGGIFDYIKGPRSLGKARKYQSTPHQRTAKHIAEDHGIPYHVVKNAETLEEIVSREVKETEIVEVFTDPKVNQAFYRRFKKL